MSKSFYRWQELGLLREQRVSTVLIIVLSLLGGLAVYYAMAWGPWAYSDGVGYIVSTRNMINGIGLGLVKPSGIFEPLVSHPPLYPLTLAVTNLFTHDLFQAGRWLDAASFTLFILVSGLLILRLTGSGWVATTSASLLVITPALLLAFSSAMAEPLFILFSFTSTLLLLSHFQNPRRPTWLASTLLAGLGIIARYPAASFLLANLILILVDRSNSLRKRLRSATGYGTIALAPLAFFWLWSFTVRSAGSPKALTAQLDLINKLQIFIRRTAEVVWTWKPISPEVITIAKRLAGHMESIEIVAVIFFSLLLISGLALLGFRSRSDAEIKRDPSGVRQLAVAFTLVIASYVVFFLVIYFISYPTPDIDTRILLPVQVASVLLIIVVSQVIIEHWRQFKWVRGVLGMIMLIFGAGYLVLATDIVTGQHRTGLGYTAKAWRESKTLVAIDDLPPGTPLISNEPIPIMLYYDMWPDELDVLNPTVPMNTITAFGTGNSRAEVRFREGHAVLILFDNFLGQLRSIYGDQADQNQAAFTQGLELIFEGSDGAMYIYSKGSDAP
ncbi:MAG: hypothetical protein E4G99_10785 [Anaerolineales bacterium]|nr:MAG: hypothetical protein E4G99_10785 [Anaerolineales bacterium]